MKTIVLLLISLVFLAFSALATGNCITNTDLDTVSSVVHDEEGKPLNKDYRYFVLPAIRFTKGGLRLANRGGQGQKNCSTAVVQSPFFLDRGISVSFKPRDTKVEEIVESSPVNIMFNLDNPSCSNLNVWKVDNFLILWQNYTLSTGAKLGNFLDLSSWFQIKKVSDPFYKFAFCPLGDFSCQNVGITLENGHRRLALSEKPAAFRFKRDKGIGKAIA